MSLARRLRRRRLWADSTGPVPLTILALNRPIQILFFLFAPVVLCFYLSIQHLSAPREGYFPLSLQGEGLRDQASCVVRVTATERGQIANITLWEVAEAIEGKNLGADLTELRSELSRIAYAERKRWVLAFANGLPLPPPPKLVFEIGDLLHAHVVALLDTAMEAGFTDLALVPIDKSMQ
jgi:hypothetical protein